MYSFNSIIRYSEVDKNGSLTMESLLDYFQDCSTFQTEDGPAPMEYLREKSLAWVVNSWQIEVKRYPKLCEQVVIGTIPYKLRGYFGHRNFFMDTSAGERLAMANSVWTLLDMSKNLPARITPEMADAYPLGDPIDMEYGDRKIHLPEDGEVIGADEILITSHHLDTNNHVNNGQYLRMAIDCLPVKDICISSMRAEYKKQAREGDILVPKVVKVSKNGIMAYTISLNDKENKPVCLVELKTAQEGN